MDGNSKRTEDDTFYGAFVIGGIAFSTICKIKKTIGYIMVVEVAWVNFLTKVVGCSSDKTSVIYDGIVRSSGHLVDEGLNTLDIR